MQKLVLVLLLFAAFLSAACRPKDRQASGEVVIAVPHSLSSLPLLMLDGGEVGGKKISTVIYSDHIVSMAEFLRGEYDLLLTGFTLGASNSRENNKIRHFSTPIWGVSSLVAKNPEAGTLPDFIGKRIAVPFAGSPLDLQLREIIAFQGLEGKIELEYSPIQQAVPMLLSGKIDGICVPEPLVSKLVLKNGARAVFSFADSWAELAGGEKRSPQVSLFVQEPFATDNVPFLKQLHQALSAKVATLQADPAAVAAIYQPVFELPEDVLIAGMSNTLFGVLSSTRDKSLCEGYLQILFPDLQTNPDFYLAGF